MEMSWKNIPEEGGGRVLRENNFSWWNFSVGKGNLRNLSWRGEPDFPVLFKSNQKLN
jgi:hypothetical protein